MKATRPSPAGTAARAPRGRRGVRGTPDATPQVPGRRAASREAALAGVVIAYPPELPVSQRKDDIAAAIRDHQVVIIAGETGSGKTTQIPKICLELGRG